MSERPPRMGAKPSPTEPRAPLGEPGSRIPHKPSISSTARAKLYEDEHRKPDGTLDARRQKHADMVRAVDIEGRKASPEQRRARKAGDVVPSRAYASGGQWWLPGFIVGFEYYNPEKDAPTHVLRRQVQSVGRVQIGMEYYLLATAIGSKAFYLGKSAKLWRHPTARLPRPAPNLRAVTESEVRSWADAAHVQFIDATTPKPYGALMREAVDRYARTVRALVDKRILDAACAGFTRTPADFALGVSKHWAVHDLIYPRTPDLHHALLVSLVLGLEPAEARGLIELGAHIGSRVPLLDPTSATQLYIRAQQLMARACPEWWNLTYLTNWMVTGTVTEILERQWAETLRAAWARDVDPSTAAGITEAPLSDSSATDFDEDD